MPAQQMPPLPATDVVQKCGSRFLFLQREAYELCKGHFLCRDFVFSSSSTALAERRGRCQQAGGRTAGLGADPYLAHVQQPALFSLVYEAVDDEPGLLVCLKI